MCCLQLTNYSSKMDIKLHDLVSIVAVGCKKYLERYANTEEAVEQHRLFITDITNSLNARVQMSACQVMWHLLGYGDDGDYYTSHPTYPLHSLPFLKLLAAEERQGRVTEDDVSDDEENDDTVLMRVHRADGQASMVLSSKAQDYLFPVTEGVEIRVPPDIMCTKKGDPVKLLMARVPVYLFHELFERVYKSTEASEMRRLPAYTHVPMPLSCWLKKTGPSTIQRNTHCTLSASCHRYGWRDVDKSAVPLLSMAILSRYSKQPGAIEDRAKKLLLLLKPFVGSSSQERRCQLDPDLDQLLQAVDASCSAAYVEAESQLPVHGDVSPDSKCPSEGHSPRSIVSVDAACTKRPNRTGFNLVKQLKGLCRTWQDALDEFKTWHRQRVADTSIDDPVARWTVELIDNIEGAHRTQADAKIDKAFRNEQEEQSATFDARDLLDQMDEALCEEDDARQALLKEAQVMVDKLTSPARSSGAELFEKLDLIAGVNYSLSVPERFLADRQKYMREGMDAVCKRFGLTTPQLNVHIDGPSTSATLNMPSQRRRSGQSDVAAAGPREGTEEMDVDDSTPAAVHAARDTGGIPQRRSIQGMSNAELLAMCEAGDSSAAGALNYTRWLQSMQFEAMIAGDRLRVAKLAIEKFTLNPEQKRVVRIVAKHVNDNFAALDCEDFAAVSPLNVVVAGGPGCGKSWVMQALALYFAGIGVAASTISGSTLYSALQIEVYKPRNRQEHRRRGRGSASTDDMRKELSFEVLWQQTWYLLVDEYSMLYASLFEKMNARLRELRATEEQHAEHQPPFGNMSILLSGDVKQFGPIGGTALYAKTTKPSEGVRLYKTLFDTVVLLEDGMRFKQTESGRRYQAFLERFHNEKLTEED
ncbi:unnamed protein product [Vitrella brassicaformis CCMP3155]|uniref:ATP-dependent DNA helicase n=1 Tax=Vitrella brassicaformis (strain CCMP3155) TaxID=1169540 RepID=A0A0G4EZ63_VITBC|nr:unnamed protein product [Vitrella brassicaformis CCMP3155]|eukprot:CEM04062.1 unnamed protein product [Vitrella brassicaformis CCMP3155]